MYRSSDLHDVRIAVKKLRYGVELSQEAGLGGTRTDLTTLTATQDVLGRLHDLEVLIEWARDAQASSTPPELTTWRGLASLVRALENECRLLHARYLSSRAKLLGICDRAAERQPPTHATRRAVS
jgi:CHAD domain-containing protein